MASRPFATTAPPGPGGRGRSLRDWACFIAAEYLRIHELVERPVRRNLDALARVIGYDDQLDAGAGMALRDALDGREDADHRLSAAMLDDGSLDAGAIKAAINILEAASPHPRPRDATPTMDVEPTVARVINHPFGPPAFGVDMRNLLRGVRHVRLEDLDNDHKVRVDGTTVLIDRRSVAGAIDLPVREDERRALAVLYLVHELVHVAQAIGDKTVVSTLRSTGMAGETNLMHMDLGADHAAACIVNEVFPRWSLAWLKDLQGRSLTAFPATPFHSSASRFRKVQRFVGLRVDYIQRTSDERRALLGSGYAFADFGPAGGPFMVLIAGHPFAALGATTVTQKQTGVFFGAIDPACDGPTLNEVDELLGTLLDEALLADRKRTSSR